MQSYYYVQCIGGYKATVKHPSLQSAQAESLRLSSQHPGAQFEILHCIGITQTTMPSTFWMDGVYPAEFTN